MGMATELQKQNISWESWCHMLIVCTRSCNIIVDILSSLLCVPSSYPHTALKGVAQFGQCALPYWTMRSLLAIHFLPTIKLESAGGGGGELMKSWRYIDLKPVTVVHVLHYGNVNHTHGTRQWHSEFWLIRAGRVPCAVCRVAWRTQT